jgi:hypothetical protein
MKVFFPGSILWGSLLFSFASCSKSGADIISNHSISFPATFQLHHIPQGQHSSDQSVFIQTMYDELKFTVKFDSTAVYKTAIPENQYDINKLYGFSDNNAQHHEFSARIGWRWSEGALRLFGYIYNNGIRSSEELTTISIGDEHNCSVKVSSGSYIFTINGVSKAMPRSSAASNAKGYKLFPYFGGDETAPHDIHIWIKEK